MKFKRIRFILGFSFLLVSFQNCNAPKSTPTQDSSTSKDTKSASSSSAGSNSQSSSSGMNSGNARSITGGSSGSKSNTGFSGISAGSSGTAGSSGSGGSSSGSGGTCLGCATSGSGTGSSGNNGGNLINGGSSDTTFRITTQPVSKTIAEGTEFFVGVSVTGGKGPYSFKWYLNGEEIPPAYGDTHYESYSTLLDRIYKEGDYHVTITDGAGAKLNSNKAQIRMISKTCSAGNYFIDLRVRTNPSDGYSYFNDLFYYKNRKYLVSQHNSTISMMQLNTFLKNIGSLGFGYFSLGGTVSNNQNFSIECSTDVPTIHTSECATNNPSKCYYYGYGDGSGSNKTYEGKINFLCRNGYIEFISNTCQLVPGPPPPDNSGG
ncbi:MAG: hypothetical protein JNL11_12255 [Bdellovibrionaceae bacterium]|nr:hypothetical protein [Pseudobdellovibrionaceae bacterium]